MPPTERKVTTLVGGKPTPLTDVPFTPSPLAPEVAFEYQAADGSTIRVRFLVTAILRQEGEWDHDGHPAYIVRNSSHMSVVESAPARRKPMDPPTGQKTN